MMELYGAKIPKRPNTKSHKSVRMFVDYVWNEVYSMNNEMGQYGQYKYRGVESQQNVVPFLELQVQSHKENFKFDYLEDAYKEISFRICKEIVREFQSYIEKGKTPGVHSKSNHPAIARGETDPASLLNALEIVPDENGWYGIKVVNKVWLYQEYGFDMHGKLPGKFVVMRILEWAIAKGIVFTFDEDKQKRETDDEIEWRKGWNKVLLKDDLSFERRWGKNGKSTRESRYSKKRLNRSKEAIMKSRDRQIKEIKRKYVKDYGKKMSMKRRNEMLEEVHDIETRKTLKMSRLYRPMNMEDYAGHFSEDGSGIDRKLLSVAYRLTRYIVENSKGRNNRRLFLTVAYRSVVSDRALMVSIQRQVLNEYIKYKGKKPKPD